MQTPDPEVSVLMPTFNVQKYVEEAIKSVLAQSRRNFELLVQDDGSMDGTVAVVRRLAAADKRLILPPFPENRGVIAARNSLLSVARGKYIAWMDSDDSCHPERLDIQIRFLEANPDFGAVGTGIALADEELRPFRRETYSRDPARQAVDPEICCATIVARREAVEKAGPFREIFRPGGEDGDWLLRMADHTKITNIDDILYTYRQHNSTTRRGVGVIRRLGVMARVATRLRRAGRGDPLDRRHRPVERIAHGGGLHIAAPDLGGQALGQLVGPDMIVEAGLVGIAVALADNTILGLDRRRHVGGRVTGRRAQRFEEHFDRGSGGLSRL